MKLIKTFLCATLIGSLTAQSTGAADMAMLGAARPMPLAAHFPPAAPKLPPSSMGASRAKGPSLRERLQGLLSGIWEAASPAAPAPAPATVRPQEAVFEPAEPEPVPLSPAPDRMLVLAPAAPLEDAVIPEPDRPRAVYEEDSDKYKPVYEPAAAADRSGAMEAPWFSFPGGRARITYLGSLGRAWIDQRGFHYRMDDRVLDIPTPFAKRYHRSYPVYARGSWAACEIEVENTGAVPLRDVEVRAAQETFEVTGGRGNTLSNYAPLKAGTIEPGGRAVLELRIRLSLVQRAFAGVVFEQTHLTVKSGEKTLSDQTQAGLVDP